MLAGILCKRGRVRMGLGWGGGDGECLLASSINGGEMVMERVC